MGQQKVLLLSCAPTVNAFCSKAIHKQQISIHAMHIFELEKLFLKNKQNKQTKTKPRVIDSLPSPCRQSSIVVWFLPRCQVIEAPAWPVLLVGDEWGGPGGPFLQSSREEEPGGKAEGACLVERCVDNDERLRSAALFNLSVLRVADKWQL